jgi:hypothetical protein
MAGKPDRYPGWHRAAVGGREAIDDGCWTRIGQLQLSFLIKQGLKPSDNLLEIACGAMRGAVHFIDYLEPGRYFGLEKEAVFIEEGRRHELDPEVAHEKRPLFFVNPSFDLSLLPPDVTFRFAFSHSLFTHLPPELITACLHSVAARLAPGGAYYSSFHPAPKVTLGKELSGHQAWRKGELWNAKYPLRRLQAIAHEAGLTAELVGKWGHPQNKQGLQLMARFRRHR